MLLCVLQATLVDGGTLSNFPISLFDRPVSFELTAAVGLTQWQARRAA